MSELLIKKLSNSIGKNAVVFLKNGFRFECKILNSDEECIEIYDTKKFFNKLIAISEIAEVELKQKDLKNGE